MKPMKLKIKLLSDLCVSSGDPYNSYVDIDVVTDDYGFPYIPAKRIKGCIREACLELKDFYEDMKTEGSKGEGEPQEPTAEYYKQCYDFLFGKEGEKENSSAFSLDNAYLEDYPDRVAAVKANSTQSWANRQNVMDLYTYVRSQTAINENGSAEENTLRSVRVVRRDLTFHADLEFLKEPTEEQKKALKDAVSMVKHIGVGRTRGLGLVTMWLKGADETSGDSAKEVSSEGPSNIDIEDDLCKNLCDGENTLNYTITLQSPLLCKSSQGNQAKTQDYIEGAKMLGVIAGALQKDGTVSEETKKDCLSQIIVSNAYPVCNGERCVPISASIRAEKDAVYENGKKTCRDMLEPLSNKEKSKLFASVGESYINSKNEVMKVDTEINYHHRRPDDKSIGRATGEDGSAFYQIESLRSGQTFRGFIRITKEEQAEPIINALKSLETVPVRMGYGRNAEYGKVKLKIESAKQETSEDSGGKDSVVILNAPVILYNKYGMLSADVNDLTEYLKAYLTPKETEEGSEFEFRAEDSETHLTKESKLPEVELTPQNMFLNYEQIGGFNVTWNRRKPVATVLGRGSAIRYTANSDVDISKLNGAFIGERTSEGYGEIRVDNIKKDVTLKMPESSKDDAKGNERSNVTEKTNAGVESEKAKNGSESESSNAGDELINDLKKQEAKRKLANRARKMARPEDSKRPSATDTEADEKEKSDLGHISSEVIENRDASASIARLILIAKGQKTYEGLKKQVEGIEKDSKKGLATEMIGYLENALNTKDDVKPDDEEAFRIATDAYFGELKYQIRHSKQVRNAKQKGGKDSNGQHKQ